MLLLSMFEEITERPSYFCLSSKLMPARKTAFSWEASRNVSITVMKTLEHTGTTSRLLFNSLVTSGFTYSFNKARAEIHPHISCSSSKAYQHLYSWGVSKPRDHSCRCVTSVGARAWVREGQTQDPILFLSDQFHLPQLTIVKLTMTTTIPRISLCCSQDVAVFTLCFIYIYIMCCQSSGGRWARCKKKFIISRGWLLGMEILPHPNHQCLYHVFSFWPNKSYRDEKLLVKISKKYENL